MEVKGHMTKNYLQSSPPWKTLEGSEIALTKVLKCFRRKTFKIENCVVLAEYFEQQKDCNRCKRKISKSSRSPLWRGISRIYISLSNKWKPCHGAINSRPRNFKNGTKNVLSISQKL